MRPDSIWPEPSASACGAEVVRRWESILDKAPRLGPWLDQMLGRQRMHLQQSGIAQLEVERSLWQDLRRWLADFEALPQFAVSAIAVTLEDEVLHQVDPAPPDAAAGAAESSPERAVADLGMLLLDPAFALAFHCVDVRLRSRLSARPSELAPVPESHWFALLHASARLRPALSAEVAIALVLHVLSPGWASVPTASRQAALRLFLARPEDLRADVRGLCGALPRDWGLGPSELPLFVAAAHEARVALAEAVKLCARLVAGTRDRPGGLALLADGSAAPPSPEEVAELFRNFRKYGHLGGFRRLVALL
jgi:hypothetical protein